MKPTVKKEGHDIRFFKTNGLIDYFTKNTEQMIIYKVKLYGKGSVYQD
jgi:hypothetical protein